MLRIYCTGSTSNKEGSVTVWDYLSYEPILFLDLKEKGIAIKMLKSVLECSDKEYIKKILSFGVHQNHLLQERDKEREDWIKGAWSSVTNTLLKDLKIKAPNKPIENVKELLDQLDQEEKERLLEAKRKATKKKLHKRPLKKTKEPQQVITRPKDKRPKKKRKRIK